MNNVIRTRATICRNLKDYKFVPKLSNEQKGEIVEKVKNALPKFVEIKQSEIEPNTQTKLYGLQGGAYPTVLVSKKGDVGIKFFDGEHITITASDFGYEKDVFEDAKDVADELKNKLTFSYSDDYGYLMSDLYLIGNGLKLECDFVLSGIKKLNKIGQVKQNVQKLGYRLSESDKEDVYTLSTKCNLGFTEKEVFDEFNKMVQKLQELEEESVRLLASTQQDEVYDKYVRALAILNNAHILSFDELKTLTNQLRIGLNLGYKEVKADKASELQKLILCKNSQFVSKSEMIDLAKKVKKILKED